MIVRISYFFAFKYDLPEGVTTINGLDIRGKLYVPPNHKSTLRTTCVFVQGELQMSDTNPISPENESIKIVLYGTSDIQFYPADSNSGVAGTPFNAGSKPFLVAGGKLDIRGWDVADGEERVPTWTPLLSMVEGDQPEPALRANNRPVEPVRSADASVACPRVIVGANFTEGVDYSIWTGGDGAVVSHDVEEGAMVVSNIRKSWQGPRLDITKFTLDCPLTPDVHYLVTMRIKIDKRDVTEDEEMPCKTTTNTWNDCPRLARKIMMASGSDRWSHRRVSILMYWQLGDFTSNRCMFPLVSS
jgi:hypothetical protein